jgi:UDP-N-acetylmuramate: L-alanyl-gamma-D-glutamyl-meso-diaminopimelate ligase
MWNRTGSIGCPWRLPGVLQEDDLAKRSWANNPHIRKLPYRAPEYKIEDGSCVIAVNGNPWTMEVFGRHNMQNIMGARLICNQHGIKDEGFFREIATFRGAGKRLQLLGQKSGTAIYLVPSIQWRPR